MTPVRRFGLRFATSMVPCVEVTLPADDVVRDPGNGKVHLVHYDLVVKRRYGLTQAQAYARALKWTKAHGDPR